MTNYYYLSTFWQQTLCNTFIFVYINQDLPKVHIINKNLYPREKNISRTTLASF